MVDCGNKSVMSRKLLNVREGLMLPISFSVPFNFLSQGDEFFLRRGMKDVQVKFKVTAAEVINDKICIEILDSHFIANI